MVYQARQGGAAWIEKASEFRLQGDILRAKIMDLAPGLTDITDADLNFIDKKTSQAETRRAASKYAAHRDGDDEGEEDMRRKAKPLARETFDPPVTPVSEEVMKEFEMLRDKLKTAIVNMAGVDKLETLVRIANDRHPIELEPLVQEAQYLISQYRESYMIPAISEKETRRVIIDL